jgi:DNA-binding NtrC family response regulator
VLEINVNGSRVLIFDDDEIIRQLLWIYFDKREYEVFTFPHPKACPLCDTESCECPIDQACSDIILTDLEMPNMKGIDFLENQLSKGCKCKHLALMSGNLNESDYQFAKEKGIKVFKKPFSISEIDKWVKEIEKARKATRRLSDWFSPSEKSYRQNHSHNDHS